MPPNWFTNEAISNYITFIAGVIVAIIAFLIRAWLQRKKPSIVLVEKEREVSLLDIAPEARGFLQVTYNNKVVSEFYQTTFRISNRGELPLQNVEVAFSFDNPTDTIAFVLDRPTASGQKQVDIETKLHSLTLTIPFLNPQKEHGDYERLQLYSSKPIGNVRIMGSGIGWSTRFVDRVAQYRERTETIAEIIATLVKATLQRYV
jgi:hypothetical protein